MTNPAPRPALRKAPDADIHPAQGQAASVITLKRAVDVPIEQAHTTQIDLRNRETAGSGNGNVAEQFLDQLVAMLPRIPLAC